MSKRFKVLIVDDEPSNRRVVEQAISDTYDIVQAESGEQALSLFASEKPDVVLMDVLMPGLDGYETAKQIRVKSGRRWVPIIFISALGESVDIIRGLDSGGDDYINKPIDILVLHAKMRAMRRIADMQQELLRRQEQNDFEQSMANELMHRLWEAEKDDRPGLTIWRGEEISDNRHFSGDLLLHTSSFGRTYVLHADSMGHGLLAALPLLPVGDAFYSLARSGYTIPAIASRLNQMLYERMPTGRFVAATLLCIDPEHKSIEIWNGGMPPIIAITGNSDTTTLIGASKLPLGIQPPGEFDTKTAHWQWNSESSCRLFLYSDGLTDAQNKSGELFGLERLRNILTNTDSKNEPFAIRDAVIDFIDSGKQHDDISFLSVNCNDFSVIEPIS